LMTLRVNSGLSESSRAMIGAKSDITNVLTVKSHGALPCAGALAEFPVQAAEPMAGQR